MMELSNPVALLAACFWVMCIVITAFREVYMKLKPAGTTVSCGAADLVFKSLNIAEFGLTLIIIASMLMFGHHPFSSANLPLFIAVSFLLMQTSVLLPAMHKKTDLHVRGIPLLYGQVRNLYLAAELVKVCSLAVFALYLCRI